ncbi:MAG: hypothetical protein LBF79_02575 [Dysgonamonadaceae bacterium]|jgi:hypothetical protein|nr:hypothetical protein [Dysgonamonadaceae bacterium]
MNLGMYTGNHYKLSDAAKYFDVVGKKFMSVRVATVVITGAKVNIIFTTAIF